MARLRSVNAMTGDLHREYMRESLDSIDRQLAKIRKPPLGSPSIVLMAELAGQMEVHAKTLRTSLAALDKLAK